MNAQVDKYINEVEKWQDELQKLRMIIQDCGLTEEFKWRNPCYTFNGSNIALIGGFKDHCVLSFFKGALLDDAHHILRKPGENTQSARIVSFTSLQEIVELETILKSYIFEAVEVEKAELKVEFKKASEYEIPLELQDKLDENAALKAAFQALTPGRQRAYLLYFSAPKQSKTRGSRVEKYTQQILDGKGINDCVCGLSKKMPYCDGSHKYAR
jgi:uncharacterized protein YdeI (YjbR/CyaY-like superfamily)